MSSEFGAEPNQSQLAVMQAALFNLRDGLMNLRMSLMELACATDEEMQRQAQIVSEKLLARLRG